MIYLRGPQLRKRIENHTKDDVEADCCDDDEETQMEEGLENDCVEGLFQLAGLHILET